MLELRFVRLAFVMSCCVAALSAGPLTASASQQIPEWRLADRPRLQIGQDGVDLHRVSGAGVLTDGRIAIADAGNFRVLIFSPSGQLLRTLGRQGAGPGEFRSLAMLFVLGDTLAVYDPVLRRVSVWEADGTPRTTVPLPPFGQRATELHVAASTDTYVLTSLEPAGERTGGLYRDTVSLLVLDAKSGQLTPLERREMRYLYFYRQPNGSTVYSTPFLGSALIGGLTGYYLFVPLDSAVVEVADLNGRKQGTVMLPIPSRPFRPEMVAAYRDSLLKLATGSSISRIRAVFDNFPPPRDAPRVRTIAAFDDHVWLEMFPLTGASTAHWFIVDPKARRVIGQLSVPLNVRLLGGRGGSLLLLVRDALGVESVALYEVARNDR